MKILLIKYYVTLLIKILQLRMYLILILITFNKILCHASYKNTTTKNVFDFILITFNINEKLENSQHLSS